MVSVHENGQHPPNQSYMMDPGEFHMILLKQSSFLVVCFDMVSFRDQIKPRPRLIAFRDNSNVPPSIHVLFGAYLGVASPRLIPQGTSLQIRPFLFVSRNVPDGEELGETAVFAGYRGTKDERFRVDWLLFEASSSSS